MKHITLTSVMMCLMTVPALGNVASQAYVDLMNGSVNESISTRADGAQPVNGVLQTNESGNVTAGQLQTGMIETSAVTNSRLASNLGLDKLDVGELPQSGKHMMIWNASSNKYVFEELIESITSAPVPLQCDAGTYDIGFDQCANPKEYSSKQEVVKDNDGNIYRMNATFSYGVVSAVSACLRKGGTVLEPDASINAVGGEADGGNCWCKITAPRQSLWVFVSDYGRTGNCYGNCLPNCIHYHASMREALYSSVGK